MKRLEPLNIAHADVFDACVSEVSNGGVKTLFLLEKARILAEFDGYGVKAGSNNLYSSVYCDRAKPKQVIIGGLVKEDFVFLYGSCMVKKPAGRKFYDKIILLAPSGKCPLCGFGHATTLDHLLPKARYPLFSVLSTNLVPACTDCNKLKGASLVTKDEQALHPYFESDVIETEPWVYAEIIQDTPVTVKYFVSPPPEWCPEQSRRACNYFSDLNLAGRFAIEAASELSSLISFLKYLKNDNSVADHLSAMADGERDIRLNSWKSALYQALSVNKWFIGGGFR